MKLILIAAVSQNGVIGSQNSLPWYIPEDLKHFKQMTDGKACLMGKNTFDSIIARLGKPLPNRENIVVSRQKDWTPPEGVKVFSDLDSAFEYLKNHSEVMVIGGGQLYSQTIDKAHRLVLTEVHKVIDGDVMFPAWDRKDWKEVFREDYTEFSFVEYERKS